jgi:hypothetical protein
MRPQLAENAPPRGTRTTPKDTADRNKEELQKNLGENDRRIRMVKHAAKRGGNVVAILKNFFARVRNTQIPKTDQVAHKRRAIFDGRVLVQTRDARRRDRQIGGARVQRSFITDQTGAVTDEPAFPLAGDPTKWAEVETRHKTPHPARESDMITQLLLLGKFQQDHVANCSQRWMVVIQVAESRFRESAFKNTGKRGALGGKAISAVHVNQRIAGKGRAVTNDVDSVKNCLPITEFVSVFAP